LFSRRHAKPQMSPRLSCVIAVFLLGVQVPAALAQKEPDPRADSPEATYRGGLVTPPLPKPKFTLTDTSGAPFDFWSKTQGSVTLLFFGYTYCPDQCPLHMANIAVGLKKIPASVTDQVKMVFVTTDPARDSPEVLRRWLDHFDKRFIGLTGSEAAIVAAQRAAGVPLAVKTGLANGDYGVGHASFVLAYTKDNLAHVIYPSGVAQQDWVHDLPFLVKGAWSRR
jgi:protein SCO1/2